MGSLGTRMEQQVRARMNLLSSSGPLSVKRVLLATQFKDDESASSKLLDRLERSEAMPVAPQLQCDYSLQFGLVDADARRQSTFNDFGLETYKSVNWIMTESSLPTSQLSWSFSQQAIGLPVPSVSNEMAKITIMMPSNPDYGTRRVKDYFTALSYLYDRQFDRRTGLLLAPATGRGYIVLKVSLEILKSGINWDEEFVSIPLFEYQKVVFGTPQFQFDPKTAQPLAVSFPIAYSNTKWVELATLEREFVNNDLKLSSLLAPSEDYSINL